MIYDRILFNIRQDTGLRVPHPRSGQCPINPAYSKAINRDNCLDWDHPSGMTIPLDQLAAPSIMNVTVCDPTCSERGHT